MKYLSTMRVLGLIGVIVFLFSSTIIDLARGISLISFIPSYGKINKDLAEINEYLRDLKLRT